jgi:hypothetical protein
MGISTSPATGSRGQITIGEEALYGVPVSPTHLVGFTSESLSSTENVIESEEIRSDRGRHKLIRGNLDVQGDISFEQSASGFGMVMRHALYDYIKCPRTDGGIHGRVATDALIALTTVDAIGTTSILRLADDLSATFESAGLAAFVYRDAATNALTFLDNTVAGYSYDSVQLQTQTYVTAKVAADATHSGGVTTAVKLTLSQVFNSVGALVDPVLNPEGGIVKLGPLRTEARFFESLATGSGTDIWIHPDDAAIGTATIVNDACVSVPCMVQRTSAIAIPAPALKVGAWVIQFDTAYEDGNSVIAYTHLIERGKYSPTGLTCEIDRDAMIFVYSGNKVNTLTLNFETNSIVSGTASLIGRREDSVAKLLVDVVPGQATIMINNRTAFPDAGVLTIGEETGMTYSGIVDNLDGTFTITMLDTNIANVTAVQRAHFLGENVDSRSSTAVATPYEGNNSPLTAFETLVYLDGYFEEVLSGTLTMNNNLNTDKYGLGSRYKLATVEQRAVVEASLTMEFDDGKHYKKFVEGEYFSLEFKCVSEADDSLIGATGVFSQAYYYLPKCKFDGTTPNIQGDSYITHDMPITAVVDDAMNTTDLVIFLVNSNTDDVEA